MKIKILITFVFSVLLSVGAYFFIRDNPKKIEKSNKTQQYIRVTVLGAVRFHNTFVVKKGTTIKEMLDRAELLYSANINEINEKEKIFKSEELLIPFKKGMEKKYSVKKAISANILIERGIRRKTAIEIIKYINDRKGRDISWNDLDSIRGVGEVTLSLLKEILDLN